MYVKIKLTIIMYLNDIAADRDLGWGCWECPMPLLIIIAVSDIYSLFNQLNTKV